MSTAAATTPVESLSFAEMQAELRGIPEKRERAIATGDVDAVAALRAREMELRTQVARIKVDNLNKEVRRLEGELEEALAAQVAANREGVAEIERARADGAAALEAQRDAERRLGLAVNRQNHGDFLVQAAHARLGEAHRLRTMAMRELDTGLAGGAP